GTRIAGYASPRPNLVPHFFSTRPLHSGQKNITPRLIIFPLTARLQGGERFLVPLPTCPAPEVRHACSLLPVRLVLADRLRCRPCRRPARKPRCRRPRLPRLDGRGTDHQRHR